jgi:hypothetical protein
METALEDMQKCFEEYDLRINWKKTKVMICKKSQQSQRLQIKVGNNFIEQVNSYKYLGNLITQDGKTTKEIRARISQAKTAIMNRKELLCFKKMSIHIRKRLVKVFVWSVALYGLVSWMINKVGERYLENFEM